ncbi:cystathionine gamma-synthase [Nakamurella flavida]|uniref:Cystathionine gamma-synthase n=1 Tax=Nakamurella flavida TaxID=363630 RepID=A0A939C3A8_9ACTN|nr:cystathionine gamma-synthase [Nakamurella flavida]MBM9476881.1 cystathionine gamma-synthase [Nakamurella flavida]MDP9779825.1 cystathionine gamma-synthase [Nakamurella flavida]
MTGPDSSAPVPPAPSPLPADRGAPSGDGFATRAIHAGQEPEAGTGAVVVPIYQTSTFAQDLPGETRAGYDYSRAGNPTRTALQEALASLEGVRHGTAFASGMAAADTVIRSVMRPGDHVIIPDDAYGGSFRLIDKVCVPWGISYTPVPLGDLDAVRAAVRPTTRLIWCETPTNPLLGIADIAGLAEIASAAGAKLVVDNTFATPYLQQPALLGADVVLHSTTKYLGGHSDVVGGALLTDDDELGESFGFLAKSVGAVAGPFDAWLTLRGIKTLAVRMDRHCDNAEAVVELLSEHPKVGRVYYPGLDAHPGSDMAAGQMFRYGGMVSFTVVGGQEAATKVCARTRLFTLAESLGGVESLIEHPGLMTHMSVAGTSLQVPADLVRLSVGIEDVQDLLADLSDALD